MNRTERRWENMTDAEKAYFKRRIEAIEKGIETLKMKKNSLIQWENMRVEEFKAIEEKGCDCIKMSDIHKLVEENNSVLVEICVKVSPKNKDGSVSKTTRYIKVGE